MDQSLIYAVFLLALVAAMLGVILIFHYRAVWRSIEYLENQTKILFTQAVRRSRKLIALVFGATLILAGVVLLFIPGPGLLVMFGGLLVLAAEFTWARRLLKGIDRKIKAALPEKYARKLEEAESKARNLRG